MSTAAAVAPAFEPQVSHRSAQSSLSSTILAGATGLLFAGPLTFGAVEPWAISLFEVGCTLLFLLWAFHQLSQREMRIVGSPLHAPMLAFAGIVFSQLILKHTANRVETLSQGLLYASYGLLCFLTTQTLRKTGQLQPLAIRICTFTGCVALFALLQGLTSNGKLYWIRTPRFGGWIYGPYVNHNHYAGLMEMLVPIPIVIALSRHVRPRSRILAAAVATVAGSTIFLSGSRGGMVAFAGEIAVLAILSGERRFGRRKLAGIAAAVVTIGFLAWVGGRDLASRITTIPAEAKTEISGGTRIKIDQDALRMAERRPILGWGLGTFGEVYPRFRTFPTNVAIDKAHNDYLQLLVEMGGLGVLAISWFLVVTYREAIKTLKSARNHAVREMTLASIVGVTGILIHSFVDFNLQIPANAAWFYVFCTVSVMELDSTHLLRRRRVAHD